MRKGYTHNKGKKLKWYNHIGRGNNDTMIIKQRMQKKDKGWENKPEYRNYLRKGKRQVHMCGQQHTHSVQIFIPY